MKKSAYLVILLFLIDSCLDRIDFDIPIAPFGDLVVDGLITDLPGPYRVTLSRVGRIGDARPLGYPVSAKKVTILDDIGSSEVLKEKTLGVFETALDGIRGTVGREYRVRIETYDDRIFESLPDRMNPVGAVDSLYTEFEVRQPANSPTEYGYQIYIDAHGGAEPEQSYIRWKFSGTYVVETAPQYYICDIPPGNGVCAPPYCPLACSGWAYVDGELKQGYAYNPATKKVEYIIGLRCTCCRCWITEPENQPTVSDNQVVSHGKFVKVPMGYVPVNFYTFFEKYRVEVTQMSLTPASYAYWKAVRDQRDATGSLFQPITGKIPSNLVENASSAGVQGLFYASAVTTKYLYLDKNTTRAEIYVPKDCTLPPREGAMGKNCLNAFPGTTATTVQPVDWN